MLRDWDTVSAGDRRSHVIDTIMEYTACNICNGEYCDIEKFRVLLLWKLVVMTDSEVEQLIIDDSWCHPFVERWWKIFIERQKNPIPENILE